MPPGPKPLGERAMTPAERQARYRAAHAAGTAATVKVCYRRPADRRSRPQRWRDAVAELIELQADYQQWLDAAGKPGGHAHRRRAAGRVRPRPVRSGDRSAARLRAGPREPRR